MATIDASESTGPAPEVRWTDRAFVTDGLPAVSRDGDLVVIAIQDHDGGRGNPNLRFVARDRKDVERREHVVLTAFESDALFGPDGQLQGIDERLARANQWLAKLHHRVALVPMKRLQVRTSDPASDTHFRARAGSLEIVWHESFLRITASGKLLHEQRTPASWQVEPKPLCASCTEQCENPAVLQGAAIDDKRQVTVITIGYLGTDTCWEPEARHFVIAW